MVSPPPRSTLFPYTTLFRSGVRAVSGVLSVLAGARLITVDADGVTVAQDRKSTRLNSSHLVISYAVFCLKKKSKQKETRRTRKQRRDRGGIAHEARRHRSPR